MRRTGAKRRLEQKLSLHNGEGRAPRGWKRPFAFACTSNGVRARGRAWSANRWGRGHTTRGRSAGRAATKQHTPECAATGQRRRRCESTPYVLLGGPVPFHTTFVNIPERCTARMATAPGSLPRHQNTLTLPLCRHHLPRRPPDPRRRGRRARPSMIARRPPPPAPLSRSPCKPGGRLGANSPRRPLARSISRGTAPRV